MTDIKDMHWFLWEAIVMQANDMYSKGLLSSALMCDINFVTTFVQREGKFTDGMKYMACQIERSVLAKESEWMALVDKEEEEGAVYAA